MGSAADLKYSGDLEKMAIEIGRLIGLSGNVTVYGAEKDSDSLSTAAARGARSVGGLTIGVTYGKSKDVWGGRDNTDMIVATGMERGGGREFVLVNSCDAIIAISGGSGTLTEIAIAYQANIPVVVMKGSGGWADRVGSSYLDERNRILCVQCVSAREAVEKALSLIPNSNEIN